MGGARALFYFVCVFDTPLVEVVNYDYNFFKHVCLGEIGALGAIKKIF